MSRNPVADLAHLANLILCVFPRLFHLADFFRNHIAGTLQCFRLLQELAALLIQSFKSIEVQRIAAVLQHLPHFIQMLTYKFNI